MTNRVLFKLASRVGFEFSIVVDDSYPLDIMRSMAQGIANNRDVTEVNIEYTPPARMVTEHFHGQGSRK